MMQVSVWLWFYWGKIPYYTTPLQSWTHDKFYPSDGDPITVMSTDAAGCAFPLVVPQSGQHPGEKMEQFVFR